MKKIIGLAVAALIIMATVGFGTWSYFSDTETSTNNAVAAGTLTLSVNGAYSNVTMLSGLTNKAPGDSGSAYVTLVNTGSLPGKFGLQTSTVTNTQNSGIPKYGISGLGATALGTEALLAVWVDTNANGLLDNGEYWLKSDGTIQTWAGGNSTTVADSGSTATLYATYNSYASLTWANIIANMTASQTIRFYLSWILPTTAGNEIQGASTSVSLTFTLNQ